ncbi:hypothetical protein H8E07_10380 [bacterium]|nr:hypothetical protein [bacterium]
MDKHTINRRIWPRTPLVALTLILILLATMADIAKADDFDHERKGLVLGLNLGTGGASLQYERLGLAVEHEIENVPGGIGRIGFGLSDHFVITLEGRGFSKTNSEVDIQGAMALVTLTWHPGGGGFFLRGGVGGGAANIRLLGPPSLVDWEEREAEGAAGFGLGYEWRLGRQFALGLALDGCAMGFEDRPGFQETVFGSGIASLQLNWYL